MDIESKLDMWLEATTTAKIAKYAKRIGSKKKADTTAIVFSITDPKAVERLKKLKRSYEDRGVTIVFRDDSGEARVPPHLVSEIKGKLEDMSGIEL